MKAEEIFLVAVEKKTPCERAAYLEGACGDAPALRAQVAALLRSHEQAGSFLEQPLFISSPASDTSPAAEGPGTHIGPYKLLQEIGEGGMGTVYMAEQQEPVRRMVALKIIKPGMDSAQVIARFEAERQALALMDHPNIAKVLDAGTTESGRPYFVMELVKGIPITRFCDENQLTPHQRLELFLPVCQAVQHAHQKGIIHRDLKPANVLVALYDDRPVPKVIDFGVAKATSQKLTERTLFTGFGSFVGTLEYMSPEQAKLNALDIDTRSDVYALGVLLYELLTGNTPLEHERLKQTALDDLLRTIREEEPPRPSTRLSQSGEALATISARRGTEPAKLGQVLRGELDWIVMRCLEKDRTRRYETANGLARDVERYLHDEPVEACPPTAGYKLRKFARKHKAGLASATGFAALLVLGTAVSAWQAVRATQAETVALAERDDKERARQAEAEQRDVAVLNEQIVQQQRDEAERQRDEVQALNEKLQRTLYASDMNLAQHIWETGSIGYARELLEGHRPKPGETELRHFEWYYLYRLCHSELLTLKGPTGWVHSVAYTPDGKRLVSSSGTWDSTKKAYVAGEVKVWDAQTGQKLRTMKGHASIVNSVAFSLDGKRLATASDDKTVKVWDAQTGQEVLSLRGHSGSVWCVAFSPDGKRLASDGGEVKVWDAQTGQELLSIKGGGRSVTFSPDGKRLASASDSTVQVCDAQTGQELLSLKGARRNVAYSPDGKRLASWGSGRLQVKVWDAQTGQQLLSLKGEIGIVMSVAFSPDGKRLASGGMDRTARIWDVQTGQELRTIKGHIGGVLSVVFSPDGTRLASAGNDGAVKIWDVNASPEARTFSGQTGRVGCMAFSPDGKRLALGSSNWDDTKKAYLAGEVKVWDAQTSQVLLTCKGHSSRINSVSFSPDGKRLASISISIPPDVSGPPGSGEVKVWDAQTGQQLLSIKSGAGSVSFSPDGKRLAVGSKVWDAETGQELLTIKGAAGSAVFSPDGKRLASAASDNTVKVWDAQTAQELLTFKVKTRRIIELSNVAFSPDSKRLASSSISPDVSGPPGSDEVKVWDAQTGDELLTLKGHTGFVWSVVFSPDGKRLASVAHWVGIPWEVKVWDVHTGQELLSLKGGDGDAGSLAFSPTGHWLTTNAGVSRPLTVWDATPLPEK